MRGRRAHVAAIGAILVAGCGTSEPALTPVACLEELEITRALAGAPERVRLSDGTPLSRCVSRASRHEGDLQTVGALFMQIADDLHVAARSDLRAAKRLGYLIGAARRGAAGTPGIASQLARRLEQTASFDDSLTRVSLLLGVASGEEDG